MMRIPQFFVMLAAACAPAASLPAQPVALAPFRSVSLSSGGHVLVRYGPAQSVSIVEGSARRAAFAVEDGRLAIGRCGAVCPHGERLRVEIVTPSLEALAIDNGGILVVAPGFPRQPALRVAVRQGGVLDARGLEAGHVDASVEQGGMIYTRAAGTLDASVRHGGIVTWWGEAAVRRSVPDRGAVVRGAPADLFRPLAEPHDEPAGPKPPVPPIPPAPPAGG